MTVATELLPQRDPELDREPIDHSEHMIQARGVANRYDISVRTLDRWLQRSHFAFPPPVRTTKDVTGRVSARFWRLGDLVEWEHRQAAPIPKAALIPNDH